MARGVVGPGAALRGDGTGSRSQIAECRATAGLVGCGTAGSVCSARAVSPYRRRAALALRCKSCGMRVSASSRSTYRKGLGSGSTPLMSLRTLTSLPSFAALSPQSRALDPRPVNWAEGVTPCVDTGVARQEEYGA
jgi:hypothetical protein